VVLLSLVILATIAEMVILLLLATSWENRVIPVAQSAAAYLNRLRACSGGVCPAVGIVCGGCPVPL
jgi:hypothetical protein